MTANKKIWILTETVSELNNIVDLMQLDDNPNIKTCWKDAKKQFALEGETADVIIVGKCDWEYWSKYLPTRVIERNGIILKII